MKPASRTPVAALASPLARGPASRVARGVDLMQIGPFRKLLLGTRFLRFMQWAMLAVLIALSVVSWNDRTPMGVGDKLYAKTHLGTLVIWGLWWPAMIWTAAIFGRAWCAVCPLELVGDVGERGTRAIDWRGRPLPRWLAAGTGVFALYVLLQFLVAGLHLHRVPAFTSYYLIGLIALALIAGIVFRDRAFCRGFCPVGLLLGTYGRGGILAVRPGAGDGSRAGAGPDARACPSLLNPSRLDTNADCLGCVHCFKAAPPGSMRLLLRRPFPAADAREPLASWPVTGFVMVASGFVISELCSEWPAAKKVFVALPHRVTAQMGGSAAGGWIEGIWTLAVVPAVIWLLMAAALRLSGKRGRLADLWRQLALPVAVLVAAGHMSKGLAKFVSWLPFLPGAWRDPSGVETALALTQKTLSAPAAWVTLPTVSWISLGMIGVAWIVAIREYRLARPEEPGGGRGVLPLGLLAMLFGVLVAGWNYG